MNSQYYLKISYQFLAISIFRSNFRFVIFVPIQKFSHVHVTSVETNVKLVKYLTGMRQLETNSQISRAPEISNISLNAIFTLQSH